MALKPPVHGSSARTKEFTVDLVAEGIVERSEVTDGDETVAYYRISD